jgi:penicillin-binding protein 1C
MKRFPVSVTMAITTAALLLVAGAAHAVPMFREVRDNWRSADIVVVDRHGETVARVRDDFRARRGDWVTLTDTSPALRTAIVLSEDRRFYAHSGVDWQGVAAAAWANLWNTRTRGASTLTMQLAGLLDDDLRAGRGRSLGQKVGQAVSATSLERGWSKDQILEAYLNLVPFRGELVGLSAMSQTLFGKVPSGLDARESAVAVALVRAPNATAAQVSKRACGILRDMQQPRECDGLDGFTTLVLARSASVPGPTPGRSANLAPHLARIVIAQARESGKPLPPRIVSTLDAELQRVAMSSLDRHLRELAGRNVEDGAVVVIDNASGDVLAYVGSSGVLSAAAQVDHAAALRQAGSTLKPFLYAEAIEERRLTAASLLDDRPVNLPTGGGLYIPQNYDHRYAGWVTLRAALGSSLNVPAVRTLVMVTPHRFHQRLVALGLPLTQSGDYYGYSLALGSADVSLLSLTNAYRSFANQGVYGPSRMTPGAPVSAKQASKQASTLSVMTPASAYVIGDVLSDRHARARTFGLDSPLTTRFWTAVKTGTSKDMRDNWCVGWSQRYTVGVWVGNASGASMHDVSGVSGAAPVWHEVMEALHRTTPSRAPAMPPGVERVALTFDNDLEPARQEVFLSGTVMQRVSVGTAGQGSGVPAIASPADGTIFALDPDIPPAAQRVWFQADGLTGQTAHAVTWRMDGKPLGKGGQVAWLPWPGRHRVQLVDAAGKVVHEIGIEVRGAGVRAVGSQKAPLRR